jgi:hypothetical protein
MNKKQGLFTGIAVILLAAMLILAGCPMDDNGGGDNDGVTGLSTIVYTDVILQGDDGASTLTVAKKTNIRDGYELEIAAGKLTLEFFKPLSTGPIDEELNNRDEYWLFGRTDGEHKLTFDPAGGGRVGVKERGGWDLNEEEESPRYGISRNFGVSNDTTEINRQIAHVYVTGDVRITRPAKEIEVEDDDWRSGSWTAIDLPLKTGWNLVQLERHKTYAGNVVVFTLKIVDKDVDIPWIYWKDDD